MLRIDKIYECVKEYTEKLLENGLIDNNGADADYVCEKLNMDRSNVSRELNQLWKDGKLIKLQGRPVLFMDYITLKKNYPAQYIPLLIPYGKVVSSYLNENTPIIIDNKSENPLDKIVGSINGSLSGIVDDIISSISYKTRSLPVLIKGEKGLRKRSFVNAIYEYSKIKGIKADDSRLIVINCQEYQDSDEGFLKRIFGYEEEKGVFELANKGIVFLQNIHYLPFSSITSVTDALIFGNYSRVGGNRKRKLEASLIASVNESVSNKQLEFYNGVFPLIVELPSFDNRNIYEKIETVLSIFTDEAVSLNLGIIISKSILSIFLQHHYEENERQLVNYIRITCASALRHQNSELEKVIRIDFDNLPLDLLSYRRDFNDDAYVISALDLYEKDYMLCESNGRCESFDFFRTIQDKYNEKNLTDFSNQFFLDDKRIANIDSYLNESIETVLYCDEAHYHKLRSTVSNSVRLVFLKEIFSNPYYSKIVDNNRILYAMMATISDYQLKKTKLTPIQLLNEETEEFNSARKICNQLQIDDDGVVLYIASYLKKAMNYLDHTKAGIIIVSKGESIASQYKDLCMKYASDNNIRIDAIDYRDALQYNDVMELLYNKVSYIGNESGAIIITDSIPLTNIENNIKEKTGVRCKIISPLSYNVIIRCIDELSKSVSLDEININFKNISYNDKDNESEEDFIKHFTQEILSGTLTHINPEKAVDVLQKSLDEILDKLKIIKTRNITVKYLSHGVHMLERIIKHQPLNYYQLNKFSAENHNLMDIIAKSLSEAESVFDLMVPSCEIAYLAEIFLEGVE